LKSAISKTVWALSLVSLCTDIASESLYPIMPVFLKSIGFSVLAIGILEGFAEAAAGISKGYFGKLSDTIGKRLPFVRLGYLLSAISKPLMAVSVVPLWIFFARLTDRMGKGIRTAPRDAMLSSEATAETKGKIFGFHRSLDTLGAVIGPLLALTFLHFYPEQYRTLFVLALIPGLVAVALTFILSEKKTETNSKKTSFFSFLSYWKQSSANYKRLLTGLLLFALVNSSDLFLILRAKEAGLSDQGVIGIYIFYNLVYALLAFPIGKLADKTGLFIMLIVGMILFVIVYAGMAWTGSVYWYASLFLIYGIYAACTESVAKALISNLVSSTETATAIGTFNALQSLAALLASSLAGLIWYSFGARVLFNAVAVIVIAAIVYFLVNKKYFTANK
jgi:MFS family permease